MSRRRTHKSQGQVELNLAAMLDMAFQLLTFFILTFRPAPLEGNINLRMPRPVSIAAVSTTGDAGNPPIDGDPKNFDPLRNLRTLTVEVLPASDGAIGSLRLSGQLVSSLPRLDTRLRELLSDPRMPFDQVVLQAGTHLRYDALMSVMGVCTHKSLADGEEFTKLSLVEVADGPQ